MSRVNEFSNERSSKAKNGQRGGGFRIESETRSVLLECLLSCEVRLGDYLSLKSSASPLYVCLVSLFKTDFSKATYTELYENNGDKFRELPVKCSATWPKLHS